MNENENVIVEETPELIKTTEKILQEMDIFDDVFARALFNRTEFVEEIIKNVTGKQNVKIETVQTQKPIDNILNHFIVLDVFARDDQGNIYNIELQRSSEGANKERVRYYSGLTESEALKRGRSTASCQRNGLSLLQRKICLTQGFPSIISILLSEKQVSLTKMDQTFYMLTAAFQISLPLQDGS